MARPERQQAVLDILSGLKGLEPLKQLFWSELSYGLTAEEIKIVEEGVQKP